MTRPTWNATMDNCRLDLAAVGVPVDGVTSTIFNALRMPGPRLLLMHRLQAFIGRDSRITAVLSSIVWNVGYVLSGCSIGRSASIAGGVVFPHPVAIVIGNGVRIAAGCWIYQGVTLGATKRDGVLQYPSLASECRIFPGACVLGGLQIANGTVLAANSVLLNSTESGAMYAGNPAIKVKDLAA